MNWLTAGMLQGGGQALGAVGSELTKAGTTATLQDQRDAMENARAQKNLDAQKAMHTESINANKGLQTERLAADVTNADTNYKRNTEMQGLTFGHQEQLAKDAQDAGMKHAQMVIDNQSKEADLTREQQTKYHVAAMGIAKETLRAQTNGVGQLQALADGTIMKVMKDGTSSLLTDGKGVPVKGLSDITKTQQIIAEADKGLMLHYMTYLEKNDLTMAPAEKAAMQAKIEQLSTSIHNTGKVAGTASPAPASGSKVWTQADYAQAQKEPGGKAAADAYIQAHGIKVVGSPAATETTGGMLDAQVKSFKQNAAPDNHYAQPTAPLGSPVPGYDPSAKKTWSYQPQ